MKRLLNATAVVVASSLLLAGCGGGSDDGTTDTPPVVNPPDPGPVDTASSLLGEADDLKKSAMASAEAAEKASKGLDAEEVHGNSQMAVANARTILMAESDIASDLAGARAALTKAMALPDDDEGKVATVAFIKGAIEDIEGHARTVTMLANAEVRVNRVKPNTAEDHGTIVATAINGAFTNGRTPAITPETLADLPEGSVMMNDRQGQTWSEIVEAAGIMTKMITIDGGTDMTDEVEAMSVAGMNVMATDPASGVTEGMQVGSTYMGIPGLGICAGDDCEVATGTNMLVGSWYFAPTITAAKEIWVQGGTGYDDNYVAEMDYVDYGHWLTFSSGDATINRFSQRHGGAPSNLGDWDKNDDLAESATYKGNAAGMSVVRNSDDEPVRSGAFTADVMLMATFGTTDDEKTLSGTISNFDGHAGSGWAVTLQKENVASGVVSTGTAITNDGLDDENGMWTATSYGLESGRPIGIFGGFTAEFMDGEAVGAYATRAAKE